MPVVTGTGCSTKGASAGIITGRAKRTWARAGAHWPASFPPEGLGDTGRPQRLPSVRQTRQSSGQRHCGSR